MQAALEAASTVLGAPQVEVEQRFHDDLDVVRAQFRRLLNRRRIFQIDFDAQVKPGTQRPERRRNTFA